VEKAKSPRAKADTIANRTKKTITEKMEEDPFFYRKLSALLQQAIDDYKAERISEAEYLSRVTDIMEQTRCGKVNDVPEILKQNDLSRALFGAIKEQMTRRGKGCGGGTAESGERVRQDGSDYGAELAPAVPPADQILAEAAISMDRIIRKHAVVRWRENQDAQNRMRNELDDFLFDLQKEKGFALSFAEMDAIIDAAIRIAMHRTDDV